MGIPSLLTDYVISGTKNITHALNDEGRLGQVARGMCAKLLGKKLVGRRHMLALNRLTLLLLNEPSTAKGSLEHKSTAALPASLRSIRRKPELLNDHYHRAEKRRAGNHSRPLDSDDVGVQQNQETRYKTQ